MDIEHKIIASNLNLWGSILKRTSARQNFTIVIKGLANKAIGDYIEQL